MKCPYCSSKTKVLETREIKPGLVRRRRACIKCKKRFTTYEQVEATRWVIKKDGRREKFNREKIKAGILKACKKRPVKENQINEIVDQIEMKLNGQTEIKSSRIGKMVMNKLKKLDNVAYIRFASVYNEFENVGSFEKEIRKISKRRGG